MHLKPHPSQPWPKESVSFYTIIILSNKIARSVEAWSNNYQRIMCQTKIHEMVMQTNWCDMTLNWVFAKKSHKYKSNYGCQDRYPTILPPSNIVCSIFHFKMSQNMIQFWRVNWDKFNNLSNISFALFKTLTV